MLFYHETLKAKEYDGQQVQYLHEKHDGHRLTFYRQGPASPSPMLAMTRSQTNLWAHLTNRAKKHNIWPWLDNLMRMQEFSSIDGELVLPGFNASAIKTAIKECNPELKFIAFAVPHWNRDRQYTNSLHWAMDRCTLMGVEFAQFLQYTAIGSLDADAVRAATPPNIEGYVAKVNQYTGWYKIKPIKTLDAFIIGMEEGKGKYEGTLGALRCAVYNSKREAVEICACSGMTDEQRKVFWGNKAYFLGTVVEVKYQKVMTVGRLRHPIFLHIREDKRPAECTVGQDVELLRYWSNDASSETETRTEGNDNDS